VTKEVLLLDPDNFTPWYDVNLAHGLGELGWRVRWLTSPYLFEAVEAPPGVDVHHVFFPVLSRPGASRLAGWPRARRAVKGLSYPLDLRRLDRALARRRAGLIHVQWALLPALDAWFWGRWRRRGWRIVYTAHDVDRRAGTTPRVLQGSNRRLFSMADAVLVHSGAERDVVLGWGGRAETTHVVPQGGPGLFGSPGPPLPEARRILGLPPDRPVALFFGLVKPYKGLDVLLRSVAQLARQGSGVLLYVAGEVMGGARALHAQVRDLGLEANVAWSGGYVPQSRVAATFAAADVVVLPYLSSSSSAVLPLAYAHGRPVVATAVGALREMVEQGVTGLLVPPSDERALADALGQLLSDPDRARRMGEAARAVAGTRHDWRLHARLTAEVYARVSAPA
jgi:D-inositol-3-phosphate glycosyltransferase